VVQANVLLLKIFVDRSACLLTYLHGPFQNRWMDGAFLVRIFGLRVPVNPRDVVLYQSQLWHEVAPTTGVRLSLVSYCKEFPSNTYAPENLDWVFKSDFGLFND
jgi:hypothetical protein